MESATCKRQGAAASNVSNTTNATTNATASTAGLNTTSNQTNATSNATSAGNDIICCNNPAVGLNGTQFCGSLVYMGDLWVRDVNLLCTDIGSANK